jgi:diguanylate cyclase (GGDEF)-like protein
MFDSSQSYFDLVNETVFSAEAYSESRVNRINLILMSANALFILLIISGLVLYLRGLAVKRRADALGQIAYVDPLTQLDNRASCERLIQHYKKTPANHLITVFMFDMNDLKLTNDFLGHQGGDRVITAFAKALKSSSGDGFVGRFGGDEFLAVFENSDEHRIQAFLQGVQEQVNQYNQIQENTLETIRYAVGYTIANPKEQDIEDIIHVADNIMYANKRKLKAN